MMAIKRTSKQNLSHYQGTTFDFGELIPVQCLEAVQGDTFKLQTQAFMRLAPMVFPVIQPIWVRLHHWFVPYRVLWSGYEEFATGKDLTRTFPYLRSNLVPSLVAGSSSLLSRMGIYSTAETNRVFFNVPYLPLIAYWKIWAEFYADEQLHSDKIEAVKALLDFMNDKTNTTILKGGNLLYGTDIPASLLDNIGNHTFGNTGFFHTARVSWHKDYFTGARPTPIIGDEITIPAELSSEASTNGFGLAANYDGKSYPLGLQTDGDVLGSYVSTGINGQEKRPTTFNFTGTKDAQGREILPMSINLSDLMAGFALQRIFQNQNIYGNRYNEWLAAQGVRYSDKTLQLAQYLGGGKDLFDVNEVIQTSQATTDSPLGEYSGRGTASVSSRTCYHYCEEAGVILTLASIVPKNIYETQGIRKNWARRTFEDTYQPELEHLDMQPIKNSEIYLSPSATDSASNTIFGYTPRYDELRTQESYVSGDLSAGKPYQEFTMARSFASAPVLNSSFIECNPDKRIFYDQASPSVIGVFKNKTIARRHLIKRSHIKLS